MGVDWLFLNVATMLTCLNACTKSTPFLSPSLTLTRRPDWAYIARSIAWSPMATAQRGSMSAVEITPNGRHCRVKGSLSRTGIDMFSLQLRQDVANMDVLNAVRLSVCCRNRAKLIVREREVKLVGPSHPVLLHKVGMELHRPACTCFHWVLLTFHPASCQNA
jgi:hypothetical protein